ncbi:Secreted RxLR effector peptide protein, partial [Phytophthora palmivora]
DDEERAIGGGAISELATKLKGGASNLAKNLVGMNKYEAKMATKLNLDNVKNTLTASGLSKLTADVEKINSNNLIKKVSVIGILTARYGDDSLAKALVTAKKEAGDPLEVLDDYIKFVNPKTHDQTSLAKTLIDAYGSEDKVLKLLEAGKDRGHTANLLENSLLSKWAGEGQEPITAFQKLKLHLSVDDAFAADQLNNIAKYVDDFNAKNSDTKKSTLKLYTNSFGDATVARKLVSAMDNSAKRSVAMELQMQQLQGWINSGKSLDNMFTILKIEKKKGATSWQLDVLEKFISLKSGERNVVKTLTKQFGGDKDLATFLERSTSEAVELEQKMLVPTLADAQTKTGTDDGGGGGKGGAQETEMVALLRVMAKRMDKLEQSNSKQEKALAEKKNDLRIDTFMTPPQVRSPHAWEWTRMHIDSLAGSPRPLPMITPPRRVKPIHQYFAAQPQVHEVPLSRVQHLYAEHQAGAGMKYLEYIRPVRIKTTVDVDSKNMGRTVRIP